MKDLKMLKIMLMLISVLCSIFLKKTESTFLFKMSFDSMVYRRQE